MISLLIIALLVVSLMISKKNRKAAGALDLVVALLVLFFRVIPGTADVLDWILMIALFIGAGFFLFVKEFPVGSGSPTPSERG
jgi:hypothetical protein